MARMKPKELLEEDIGSFTGENNRAARENLPINALYTSQNVHVTVDNKLRTRPGESLIKSGDYKCAEYFPQLHFTLAVKDDNTFVMLNEAFDETYLSTVGGNNMVYAYHSFKVFFTNESKIGYVGSDGEHALATPTRSYRANPLPGHLLEVHGFRLWIARGKELWFTDVGKFHSVWVQRNVRQLPHRVTMMKSTGMAMYVSDDENTYLIAGHNPYKAKLEKVLPYPAIFGTGGVIDGASIGKGIPGRAAWWVSKEGVCIGTDKGEVMNLTEANYTFPACISGSSLYREYDNVSQFIATVLT